MTVTTRVLLVSPGPLTEAGAREILTRIARAGKRVWARDTELAAWAVAEQRWAVLLGDGSVVYVSEQAGRQ